MVKAGPRFPRRWARPIGIGLMAFSWLPYGAIFLLPFLPFPEEEELAAVPVLFVISEIAFWGGGALLGSELAARYRRWLSPRYWFHRPAKKEAPEK